MPGEAPKVRYLESLLCLVSALALAILFVALKSKEGDWISPLQDLLGDMAPHMIVALIASPVVYFVLRRHGVFGDENKSR